MAVIDADELFTRCLDRAERLQLFARVDDIPGSRRRMYVRAADESRDAAAATSKEPAGLTGCFLARVRDELITQRGPEPQRVGYAEPPAIAGMTMTSLPSGTAAPLPPRARASSSPMYTFT